jgi:hypothetical protein
LSSDIPQNSFRSIAAKLVGGADRLNKMTAVLVHNGVKSPQSDGVFVLSPVSEDAKHLCYVRIDVKPGFPMFDRMAADRGDPEAQYRLALCLLKGRGVALDLPAAAKYFQLAADRNHADAQFRYARCLWTGLGVPIDQVEAERYFRLAADQGHLKAQRWLQSRQLAEAAELYNLGLQFEFRPVGADSMTRAADCYRLAAEKGHAGGQNSFGFCLEHGFGVPKDPVRAAEYYIYTIYIKGRPIKTTSPVAITSGAGSKMGLESKRIRTLRLDISACRCMMLRVEFIIVK